MIRSFFGYLSGAFAADLGWWLGNGATAPFLASLLAGVYVALCVAWGAGVEERAEA